MGEIPRADPAATPRIGLAGEARRGRPVFAKRSESPPWCVEVVPLEGVTGTHEIAGTRGRASFEVRAEFEGEGLEQFEPWPGKVKRIETWTTEDETRAKAVAMAAVDLLRAGREPVLVQLAARFPG